VAEKRMRRGRDVENPQMRNVDKAAENVDMKIMFVTGMWSLREERKITPGIEESQRVETVREPMKGEMPRVRACARLCK
jgi:hypothetical protein